MLCIIFVALIPWENYDTILITKQASTASLSRDSPKFLNDILLGLCYFISSILYHYE